MPDLLLEKEIGGIVAGVDEVGRGPWAGPVVAAAVVLRPDTPLDGIADSKKLSPVRRRALAARLHETADVSIAAASVEEIDSLNILEATGLAMIRAVTGLSVAPDHVLIDGNRIPKDCRWPATAVIGGDGRSASIAAASICAKVYRDDLMARLDATYPGYGWARNAGYGTREHREALNRLGPCPEHRKSFRPIREILTQRIDITS